MPKKSLANLSHLVLSSASRFRKTCCTAVKAVSRLRRAAHGTELLIEHSRSVELLSLLQRRSEDLTDHLQLLRPLFD
eukprot:CAMPEP_0115137892 /NCGR_PEP_ID=MMETSP0227-20121206/57337_1 /TAXON_ID=89957 /ORGANISM="Polarella glacialis, Strain CCMP 1383" /LENGTH=76 /DNA_ID=CAMNT_0002545399 /DNA_START=459 /DNA_END=687 /DNA_ORIENTATION=+